jgi:hypothetical protein
LEYQENDVVIEDCEDEPKNEFEAFEDEFQGFGNATKESDFVTNDEYNANSNSRPGSFADPKIDADQEYRSNGEEDEEDLEDIKIDVDFDESPI